MKCYNIEDQNKYFFQLSGAVELEDADDEFLTEAEMKEMNISRNYSGFTMFDSKIKREVKKWVGQIPKGGSVKCTDEELIEVLKKYFTDCACGVSDILGEDRGQVGGVLRSGNKFKLRGITKAKVKAKRVPCKTDWFKLMVLTKVALNGYGLCVEGLDVPDRHLTLLSAKKIVRWYDIVAANKKGWYNSYYEKKHATKEDMAIVRKMWWKPELVIDFGKKK